MEENEPRERYRFYSEKVSELSRQLGFAGLAVIWIFKVDWQGKASFTDQKLIWAGMVIIIALGLDLIQYLAGAVVWNRERTRLPRHQSWYGKLQQPGHHLTLSKVALILIAYGLLLSYLGTNLYYLQFRSPPSTTAPVTQPATMPTS